MIDSEELANLRAVAEKATQWAPGSWGWGEMGHALWAEGDDGPILDVCSDDRKPVPAEAEHIATFDPPTVLALLADLEALHAEVDAREAQAASDARTIAELRECCDGCEFGNCGQVEGSAGA